jgi:hypothetical protein
MKWVRETMSKAIEVPIIEMSGEIKPNEKVIGDMPEDLRHLGSYIEVLQNQLKALIGQHLIDHGKEGHTEESCTKFYADTEALVEDLNLVRKIFWHEVRLAMKTPQGTIGLRKGWQVVLIDKVENDDSLIGGIGVEVIGVRSLAELLSRLK